MSAIRSGLIILALALLSPYLYDRSQTLKLFYQNAPERLPRINAFATHEVKFADSVRSCEDAILVESVGLAILPCDPGRERWNSVMGYFIEGPVPSGELYLYNYTDATTGDSDSLKRIELVDYEPGDDFHSLGLAYDESTSTLFVSNNRRDGPRVDLFKLDIGALQAKHFRSVRHDLIHGPNAIVLKNSHEFFVTNDHYFLMAKSRFLSQLETYLALPLGTVVHVDISDPETTNATVVARVPFANGIELVNKTTLAVAATSKSQVQLYTITDGTQADPVPSLSYKSSIRLPFNVDNLSLSADGRLLIAGHPHAPSLVQFAKTRYICNDPAELVKADDTMRGYCQTGQAASWVSEWTEAGGLKHLYADTKYPTSATAAYDSERKIGIIVGLYAKGILIWRD